MRILILNWRDVRNPRAGGAEVVTHEIARRLVSFGHSVTWFTSRPAGSRKQEDVDGVHIVRCGSEVTTRLHAIRHARGSRWDVVVEQINTLPYLSPLWSSERVVLFIHQLAREVWWHEAPRLVAPLGYAAEPLYLAAYAGVEAITISRSTRDDLRKLGLARRIHVIPMAASGPVLETLPPKRPQGRLLTIGRLVPSKRIDHAIEATAILRRSVPAATLTVVGDGSERGKLEALARRLRVDGAVSFAGFVSEEEKSELLAGADLLLATSVREGWGLTVTEAARMGTPAVSYDVPGLRDSVIPGRTGLLTDRSPSSMATTIERPIANRPLYARLRAAAWEEASGLSWQATARSFERALLKET